MPVQLTLSQTVKVGDKSFPANKTISGDGQVLVDNLVPAAKTGQLTTRTDNDTGVITMTAGHGLATSDVVDVYWTENGVKGARYGMNATVAVNALTVDLGAGDNLPTNMTNVTVMKQITDAFNVVGNNLQALVIYVQAQGVVQLRDADSAELIRVFKEEGVYLWHKDLVDANPVTGDTLVSVVYSHGDSTGAKQVRAAAIVN